MDRSYPYDQLFQQKLLAALVQHPEHTLDLVEPQFFTLPAHVEICRVAIETYKQHGIQIRLTRSTLTELVRESVKNNNMDDDVWKIYRKHIKSVCKMPLPDLPILLKQAKAFSVDWLMRNALERAEKKLTNGLLDSAFETIQETYHRVTKGTSLGPDWDSLPHPLDFPFEEVDWTIEGILPTDAIIAVSGDEGTGKTMQMLHWARAITEGTDFLGHRAYRRKVLYLGLDVSQTTLQQYIRMMRWVPDGDFRILSLWTGENSQPPMLDQSADIARLCELAERFKPVMVFDTVRDFFEGEENSSTATKPIMDAVRKLRALGATPILLAHPPKSGSSIIRGTGMVSQKVDIPYLLSKVKRDRKEYCVLSCPKKNRFGSTSFTLTMQMLFIPIPGNVPRMFFRERPSLQSKENARDDDALQSIVEYVDQHPDSTQLQMELALHMGDKKVNTLVSLGRKKGLLQRTKGRGNTWHWSTVTEEHAGSGSADSETAKTAAPSV